MKQKNKKLKVKIGEFYNIFDYSSQIDVDYGTCVCLGKSIDKIWDSINKKTKEKIYKDYVKFNFYSFLKNEKFYIYEDAYLIEKI